MERTNNFMINLITGIVISFVLTIILFYILGIILSVSNIPEKIVTPAILIITGVSILISSSIVNIKSEEKGLLKGGIIGTTYFIILYAISSILLKNFEINVYSLIMLVVTFFCGSIGGVVGINIKSYKK
ncbi:MAG: TIGR04086 family membrane protein [Clostridia bacterium]|nr:TIGR04086 family membrane protein [Clostridia bacterium]